MPITKYYWKVIILWMLFLTAIASYIYVPWFDEVYMSNISSNLIRTGKLYLSLAVYGDENEILEYGPVTFWIQSLFFRLFGESLLIGRLVNVLFGFGLFFLIYNWIKKNYTITAAKLILIFLLTDIAILSSLMCGRLDFISIFLFSSGLFIFLKVRNCTSLLLSGILFAFAYLSTPRIGIYLIAFLPFFFIESISQKNFKKNFIDYGILFFAFCIPVGLWIFIKFGNLFTYFKRYTDNPLIVEHVGSSTSFIPRMYQIIPLVLIGFLIIYRLKNNIKIPQHIWLFIFIIILHTIFIKEVGPYSGMMMPFVYIVLVILINKELIKEFKIIRYGIVLFLLAMLGIFMLKASVTVATFSNRNPSNFNNQIANKINKDTKIKILANYKFYYILKDMNVDYKSFDYNIQLINRDELHSFDFIIVDVDGLKRLKKLFPNEIFNEVKIDEKVSNITIPSFMKAFQNDYKGWIVSIKN